MKWAAALPVIRLPPTSWARTSIMRCYPGLTPWALCCRRLRRLIALFSTSFQCRDEEAVNVVPLGPGAGRAGGQEETGRRGVGRRLSEVGVRVEEPRDHVLVLFPLDRAGGVDEAAAGA